MIQDWNSLEGKEPCFRPTEHHLQSPHRPFIPTDDFEVSSGKTDSKMNTEAKDASDTAGMKAVMDIEIDADRSPKDCSQNAELAMISSLLTALVKLLKSVH